MEQKIIAAIKRALPNVDVYHDFAPEEATAPYVVIQRVGGEGPLYVDNQTRGGRHVRLQVAVWSDDRLRANEHSEAIEGSLLALPAVCAIGAAMADFDAQAGLRGMRQDFAVIA